MRSYFLVRRNKYLVHVVFVIFLFSTLLYYHAIQTSELNLKHSSLSRRYLVFNQLDENTESLPDRNGTLEVDRVEETELLPIKAGHGLEYEKRTITRRIHIVHPVTEPSFSPYKRKLGNELKLPSNSQSGSEDENTSQLDDLKSIDWHQLTIDEIDEIYFRNKKAIQQTMNERRSRMLSVCSSLTRNTFNRPYLFHFRELKLSWCPTYKAGSTTWKDYFVKRFVNPELSHPDLKRLWNFKLSGAGGRWPDGRKKYRHEEKSSIRFTVVRNPIVRVISYWKMSRSCGELVRVGMHRDIMLARPLSRPDLKQQFLEEFDSYFQWCFDTVADKPGITKPSISSNNPYLNPPHITFVELVDKMEKQRARLKHNDWEGHWAPASEWCDVCTHKLDYVAKLENEPWELWFLVDTLGLWADREQFLSIKNMASDSGKPSGEEELAEFISLLNSSQIKFLNSFYSNDFVMFNYDNIT